jgi:hypothetical protein
MMVSEIVDPEVAGLIRSLVRNDYPIALRRELAGIAREEIQAVRQVDFLCFVGGAIGEICVCNAVLVDDVGVALAVGRETACVGLPFQVRHQGDFPG